MDVNDEFGLDEAQVQEPAPKPAAKRGRKAAEPTVEISTAAADEEIDPERDFANWPVIIIEREKDRPNFEFMQVQGTYRDGTPLVHQLRVMRGVEVAVPPSIVGMLRTSIATHYEKIQDPLTGVVKLERSDRSSVPWRLVRGGKYC